ncbi:MAG: substrate-binding domain-containing protein [Eubacteriales bacterium]|nr:substrate-binding domain-containing protein [Eubacteriales bacterium]
MKKLIALLLTLAMALSLAACGAAPAAPETKAPEAPAATEAPAADAPAEELHFVYVSPLLSHPIWLIAKNGFDAACQELGIQGDWVGPQGISAEEMAQLVDTAVAQGADAIISQSICPVAPLQNAIDEGIPVLLVDGDHDDLDGRLAYLGKDLTKQAELMYEEVAKVIPADQKIVMSIQCANLNAQFYVDQNNAVEAAFSKHPGGFELTNVSVSTSDKAIGTNEWLNTFNTYPEVNVCINLAAEAAAACVTAADELNITDSLVIVGVDDTEENLALLREGKILCTSVVSFWNYGYQAAYWLYQNITEGRVPQQVKNDGGTMMVTKDNIDTYNDLLKVKVDLPAK